MDNFFLPYRALMSKPLKKQTYLHPFPRIFTRENEDAYDTIPFRSSDYFGDESSPALDSPLNWSPEAVAVMAGAAHPAVPADLRSNEENTVPSWLWRHQSRSARREAEFDMRDIVNRAVGSAAAKAWKMGLFSSERHARAFYDEARYALMQRHIAILPDIIASWGLAWAYGIEEKPKMREALASPSRIEISNAAIDQLLSKNGKKAAQEAYWKKMFSFRDKDASSATLRLCDIAADWQSTESNPARAAFDLMALRHNDGSLNVHAVRHAVRLLSVLLDLQERRDVTISFANLAPLLMALGLEYDSDAGRAMAASIAALVTAEGAAVSAEMAALRGASDTFAGMREGAMRVLRNHRRAAYGDGNDYEKISVLPAPLPLKHCPDLLLVAEAQRRWDDAIAMAQAFGLRTIKPTDLTPSPAMAVLMSCASQGLAPLKQLSVFERGERDAMEAFLHPAAHEALSRLGYPDQACKAVAQHIVGSHSLSKAPVINFASLGARGLGATALEKIEAYLPFVNSIRLAATPWIVGVDYCLKELKISARKIESPHFDLLSHLGFSFADVESATKHIFGHGTARNAKAINIRHRPLFARDDEISAEARIRMAAAVQSFISGDTGISVSVSLANKAESGAKVALMAWQLGLKSLEIAFDPDKPAKPLRMNSAASKARRIKAKSLSPLKPALSARARSAKSRAKKSMVVVGQKKSAARRAGKN